MAFQYDGTHTLSLPPMDPPSWRNNADETDFDRDRLRLGRELLRDFDEASFASVTPPDQDTDTLGSVDVGEDANATSTKRISPHVPIRVPSGPPGAMLLQTPSFDSKLMRDNFVDFTMAMDGADNSDADSYEIGRLNRAGGREVSFMMDHSTDFFSIGGVSGGSSVNKIESRKRPGTRLDDNKRSNSLANNGKNSRTAKMRAQDRSLGSPVPKSSFANLNFEPPAVTPKRATGGRSRVPSDGSEGPSKITDFVSNSGSGGSRASRLANHGSSNYRDLEEDALSNTRNTRRAPRYQHSNSSSLGSVRRSRQEEITGDVPAILAKTRKSSSNAIPKAFKSTNDFLKELGLDGHTRTIDLRNRLEELKDVGPPTKKSAEAQSPPRHSNDAESLFLIPSVPDMTELFSMNDATRFSAKKGAATKTHMPIGSIPIPHDTRALLTAMRLLQEKVENLEGNKASNEQKCVKLRSELQQAEYKYQQEMRRARLAEEEMRKRGLADSTFGGSEDGDMEERQKEKARVEWMMQKLSMCIGNHCLSVVLTVYKELESSINNLQDKIVHIQQKLDTSKIALRNMQEERNAAINSVAAAIAANEDLRAANLGLQDQLELAQQHIKETEERGVRQRDENRAREDKLRQRTRKARETAAVTAQAMKEAARRDGDAQKAVEREEALKRRQKKELERQERARFAQQHAEEEQEELRRLETKWEFDRRVEEELRSIRPDLFIGRQEPFTVPSFPTPHPRTIVEVAGKQRVIAVPKSRKAKAGAPVIDISDVEISTERYVPERNREQRQHLPQTGSNTVAAVSSPSTGGDSTVSISPEEVRRIAREINNERKKRKAAAAAEKVRLEEEQRQQSEGSQRGGGLKQVSGELPPAPAVQVVEPAVESAAPAAQAEQQKSKGLRVLKTVTTYVLESDATEVVNLESEINGSFAEALKNARTAQSVQLAPQIAPQTVPQTVPQAAASAPAVIQPVQEPVLQDIAVGAPREAAPSVPTPVEIAAAIPLPRSDTPAPRPASARVTQVAFAPASAVLLEEQHIDEDHDVRQCTVCVRFAELRRKEEEMERENPLRDIDNSCLFPAPELEPASQRPVREGFEEEATLRPSVNPKVQLERVVRQLKDEFRHLKM
jgi:hypothetical protein